VLYLKNVKILDAFGSWGPFSISLPRGKKKIFLEGGLLFPGVWDLHVHGGGGASFSSDSEEEIKQALRAQYFHGTSALVATLPIMPPEETEASLRALKKVMDSPQEKIARLLGVYLEGPFINPEKVGGMEASFIKSWNKEIFLDLLKRYQGLIKIVTIAPEVHEAKELIKELIKNNIKVAIGHTKANDIQTLEAIRLGVSIATHIFNAMGEFHHRAPNAAFICLLEKKITAEFIPEVGHLNPIVQKLIVRLKGKKALAVSDGTPLSAGGPSEMIWLEEKIMKKGGSSIKSNGRLFGSAITLLEGLMYLEDQKILSLNKSIPANLKEVARILGVIPCKIDNNYKGPLYHLSENGELRIVD